MIAVIALLAFAAVTLDFAVPGDGVPATIVAGLVLFAWLMWRLVKFLFAPSSGETGGDGKESLSRDACEPASDRHPKPR